MAGPLGKYKFRDDAHLVADVLSGHEGALHCLLYEQYAALLHRNAAKAAYGKAVEYDDLLHELYLYLRKDDWHCLRGYDPQQPFVNWFSVVSYRFFKDFSRPMIDSGQMVPISTVNEPPARHFGSELTGSIRMDLLAALARLVPPRDREIIEALLLRDEEPAEVAERHGVTIDNLYNIKRRALARLAKTLTAYA